MINYAQGIVVVILEMFFYKMFMEIFFDYKPCRTEKQKMLALFLLIIFAYFAAVVNNHIMVKEGLCYILMLLFGLFLFQERCFYIGIMTVVYLGLLLGIDYLIIFIYTFFFSEKIIQNIVGQSLVIAVDKIVLFLAITTIMKKFGRKKVALLRDEEWIGFLFFPIFSIGIITTSISNMDNIVNTEYETIFWFIAFGVVGMNVLVFYLLRRVVIREEKLREKQIAEEKANQQLLLYQSFVKNFDKQNERMHEYKNQIECLQTLSKAGKYVEIDNFLAQIGDELHGELDCINTNHSVVNAVLNAKYQEACNNNITFALKINDLSGLWLEEKDIVVMLSNLLDNAIEALEDCGEERIMKVKMILEDNNFIVSVRNVYNGELKYNGETLLTTKGNKDYSHGLGIGNVIKVVNKYNGFYAIRTEDGEFLFSIMIPKMF